MSGIDTPPFGEFLRALRIRAGLSQEALAEASGVSARTISDLERGQRARAHLETMRLLADALALSDDERRQFVETARPESALSAMAPHSSYGSRRWTATLPAPATPLVGRTRELAALLATLGASPDAIVTLTGPGGVGKTRLAIEVAHRLVDSFADGAAFVSLATVTQPNLAPDAIARALGMSPQNVIGVEQLIATLAPRELLLILDNLEHVIDAAPMIAQLKTGCPHLSVLVTSRVRLRISRECEFVVAPLSLADHRAPFDQQRASDANQLFAARARSIDPGFALSNQNAADVSEICRRLDGLPLAIELAASRLRILPLPALLARLDTRLPLLTGGDRDLPLRQQSMRETIAWSYELLQPDEQRFLRWMSIFAGGLSLESAEALGQAIGFSSVDSLEAVTTLVESGLALRAQTSQGTVRFALFETIREFGLEQLEQAGELEATRRFHAEHFLAFASRETPQPDELVRIAWVVQLSGEHTNLMQAFDVLCTPETAEQSLRFAAALGPYWQIRGPSSEAAPRIQRVLALSPPEPTTLWMQVLYWASCVLGISHDYQGALQAAHQCMEIARQIGTPSDMACALQALAWVQEYHEQFDTARELLEQALEGWTSVGNMAMQAVCLMLHGGLEYAAGNFERARREAQQARETFQAMGDLGWTAGATWYEGIIAVAEGRLGLAAACYAQSLRDWTQSESSSRWFKPLVGLADVAAAIGQYPISARLLGAADEMIAVSGRGLMPFDKPGYERAREACIRALGSEEFEALIAAGRRLVPEEWLAESNAIVESARAFRSRDA